MNSNLFRLVLLICGLGCVASGRDADLPRAELDDGPPALGWVERERFRLTAWETQERYRMRVAIPDADCSEASPGVSAGVSNSRTEATDQGRSPPLPSRARSRQMLLVLAVLLVVILSIRSACPEIGAWAKRVLNPDLLAPFAAAAFSIEMRSERKAFAEFLAAFRVGLPAASRPRSLAVGSSVGELAGAEGGSQRNRGQAVALLAQAPELVLALRKLLQKIGRDPDPTARQKTLAELHGRICAFKTNAGLSESPSAWKVACALERLLKQLAEAGNPAVSPLRTVACGLDLLDALCVPGLEASLAASPPFRVLVVDDDRVSRCAISQVVKRALNQPDLAEDGAAALALAGQQTYDVIFLDVQMPGMNGFELCSKIHETDCNRTTPVMFVTCQSDFNARVQSVLVGGEDLIAKPFLTFDLTVKALILALRRRILKSTPGAFWAPAMA